jgi:hypothetical protein
MSHNLPLPIAFAAELADAYLAKPAGAKSFVSWLLRYWHLLPLATTTAIAAKAADGASAEWASVIERAYNPTELDLLMQVDYGDGPEGLLGRVMQIAVRAHDGAGQVYGNQPYSTHLLAAATVARQYDYLLPEELRDIAVAVEWLHDYIEDGYGTMNDVAKFAGMLIARFTQLMVSSTGATRKERHDQAYYDRVASELVTTYDKLCDRLANVSNNDGSAKSKSMRAQYRQEEDDFEYKLDVANRYPQLLPLVAAIRTELNLPLHEV